MSLPHDLRALLRNKAAAHGLVSRGLDGPMGETALVRDGTVLRVFHRDSFVGAWTELPLDRGHTPSLHWQDFNGELKLTAQGGRTYTLPVGSFEREALVTVLEQPAGAAQPAPPTPEVVAAPHEPPAAPHLVQGVADVLAREHRPSVEQPTARPADSVRRAAQDGNQPDYRPRTFHPTQRADGSTVPVQFHGVNPLVLTCPFVLIWGAVCFVGLWHLEGMARVALIEQFEWWWLVSGVVNVIAKILAVAGGLYAWIKGIVLFDKSLDKLGYSPMAEFKTEGLELRGPRNRWRQFLPYTGTRTVWQTRTVVSGGKNKSTSHQCRVLFTLADANVALFGDMMPADFRDKLPAAAWHVPERFEPHPRQCAFPAASLVTMLQRWLYLTGATDKDLSLEAGGQKSDAKGKARKSGR